MTTTISTKTIQLTTACGQLERMRCVLCTSAIHTNKVECLRIIIILQLTFSLSSTRINAKNNGDGGGGHVTHVEQQGC